MLPLFDTYLALERAQHGDVEFAIQQWRAIVEDMERGGKLSNIDLPLMFMAEQLLSRGDYDEAAREIERLMLVAVGLPMALTRDLRASTRSPTRSSTRRRRRLP